MARKLKESLKLIATAEDKATKEFFAVVRFRTVKGTSRRRHFSLATLDDTKALRKELITMGAYFESDCNDSILALRAAREGVPHWEYAKALGWNGTKFVQVEGVIGEQSHECIHKPPRVLHRKAKKMVTGGSVSGWQKQVAEPAARSSRTVTAICAAFGTPLLKFTDAPSFALFFTGPSKLGKSTSTLAAGSVIGFKTEKKLPNFRCTDAALSELPVQFNDHMLPLNEGGSLRGTPKERRQRMRELTFGAAEGHSTTYSQRAPGCDTGQDESRSILVANGEETSDELAMLVGEFRIAGECSKWIDVPAIEGGSPDIFDLGPDLDPQERAAWFKKTCADIRAGCSVHHGRAIQRFISEVIARRKTIRAELVALRDQFVEAVAKAGTDHVALHMANNFGHLYAAGVLAVRFAILPWSERLVFKSVRRCYRAARREIKTESELLRKALLRLKARAEKKTVLLDKRYNGPSLKNVDGYRQIKGKKTLLTVRAETFKRWFEDPRQPRLLLDWIRKQGLLRSGGMPAPGQEIVWAESQFQWPDGTRPRSIVIVLGPALLNKGT
jgi:hypothetical protein